MTTTVEKIKNKNKILQFCPLKLLYLTETKYIVYKNKKLKTTYLIDIVNKFLFKRFLLKKRTFRLHSVILREMYGETYNYYFDYLKEKEIIILEKNYLASVNAREYSLNNKYLKGDLIRYENKDKILVRKWKNRLLSYNTNLITEKETIKQDSILEETIIKNKWLTEKICDSLFSIKINFEQAKNHILNMYNNGEINKDSLVANLMNIESINNGNIYYHTDKYGRLHTNFTTLKRELRTNYLTIDNEEIVELDIKNSQPIFLLSLLKDYDFHKNYKSEYDDYFNTVKNGNFYEKMAKEMGNDFNRDDAKLFTYKVFFGQNNIYVDYNKAFFRLYPNIYRFIVYFKLYNKKHDEDYSYHKILSAELQRRESNLIFDKICTSIFKEFDNIKLFTVHDSIFFPKKYENRVNEIFYNEVNKLFM